ncbi:MAG: tetratricopeptide repeat protein [Candidatus Kapabacteria bacterium]|nr:tetratricopeptide repeat protein [Candidatus Kapabacteria bacterium]
MSTERQETVQDNASSPRANGSGLLTIADRLRSQWKIVIGVIVVLGIATGAYWWYTNDRTERNAEASTQLSRIRMTFDLGEYSKALTGDSVPPVGADKVKGLLEISEDYSGTDAGSVAALMSGNALLNLGRFAEAQVQFERAQSSDAQIVEIGALQGLASCKEAAKDFQGAASIYEKAGTQGAKSGLEDRCYYHAALCFEKAGNKEKAIELYTLVIKKFEMSEVAASARGGLARLGMAID